MVSMDAPMTGRAFDNNVCTKGRGELVGGRLEGKSALVTGAARGLGAAIAQRFVEEGARVVAADIRKEQGEALANKLGKQVSFRELDVTDANAWRELAEAMHEHPIDVLVNNA